MSKEFLKNEDESKKDTEEEKTADVSGNNYQNYLRLGGIINEEDYQSAIARLKQITVIDKTLAAQAEAIAKKSGILLHNSKDSVNAIRILYGILRSDKFEPKDPEKKYHHSQMSDQHLFAETLRILGDEDSLKKLIEAYPNISFKW